LTGLEAGFITYLAAAFKGESALRLLFICVLELFLTLEPIPLFDELFLYILLKLYF